MNFMNLAKDSMYNIDNIDHKRWFPKKKIRLSSKTRANLVEIKSEDQSARLDGFFFNHRSS